MRCGRGWCRHDWRRSMSTISEEADPSEARAAVRAAAAGPVPSRGTFNRFELSRILNLYGRMVAEGEWRGYSHAFLEDLAGVLGVPESFGSADLSDRESPAAGAQAGHLQRDLGDGPDPAPRP